MNNSLLFNNIHYNKIIKKNISEEHPNKNIFINIFILLFFIIILGLFLSYRYKCKQNIKNNIEEENNNNNNLIEEENIEQEDIIEKKEKEEKIEEKKKLLDNKSIQNQKQILLDIQNNNFGNNLDIEDEQYHLI